jgi:hypothetical protein
MITLNNALTELDSEIFKSLSSEKLDRRSLKSTL